MTVHIVTDSACDLPHDLVQAHGITVVPLSIRFGADEYVDRQDLTPQQFWAKVKASPVLPETAAPAPGLFEQAFRDAATRGATGVVCITLSSKLSATIGSARLAAGAVSELIEVRVIDSLSITSGQGSMCLAAARASEAGQTLDAVAALVTSMVGRVRVFGALDTLDNLKKGGRIGGAQALLGSLLQIKPVIDVSSGEVHQEAKPRTRTRSLVHLVELVRQAVAEHGRIEDLAVMHGDAADIDQVLGLLAPIAPRSEILVGQIGAVIGTHGGPGVVGITFTVPNKASSTPIRNSESSH